MKWCRRVAKLNVANNWRTPSHHLPSLSNTQAEFEKYFCGKQLKYSSKRSKPKLSGGNLNVR